MSLPASIVRCEPQPTPLGRASLTSSLLSVAVFFLAVGAAGCGSPSETSSASQPQALASSESDSSSFVAEQTIAAWYGTDGCQETSRQDLDDAEQAMRDSARHTCASAVQSSTTKFTVSGCLLKQHYFSYYRLVTAEATFTCAPTNPPPPIVGFGDICVDFWQYRPHVEGTCDPAKHLTCLAQADGTVELCGCAVGLIYDAKADMCIKAHE